MTKRILLFVAMMFCAVSVFAQKKILDSQLTIYMLDNVTSTAVVTGNSAKQTVETINIPETVTWDEVTYSVTSIGDNAFKEYPSLTSVTIPNSVTSIGEYAFYDTRLASVTISNGVTSIGNYTFFDCNSLASVTIPNSVKSIGVHAFSYCRNLTSVTIPNSVKSIGVHAFSYCRNLTSVTIPNSVTSIGSKAFYECTGITDVYCYADPDNLTWTGSGEDFQSGGSTMFHVPSEYLEKWKTNFQNAVNVTFDDVFPLDDDNADFRGITYTLYNESHTASVSGHTDALKSEITIPSTISSNGVTYNVTSIGSSAFRNTALTSVTIPNSVTSIGKFAFQYCSSLTSVTIPNSVTSIGNSAFYECTSLASVTIPNSVTSIGDYAFYYCGKLTSVTIPNSVTSIGEGAFSNTALTSVTIPNSVTSIGTNAFKGCTSVTDVYCYADPDNLTWNDGGCDDFKSGRATKCHVQNFDKWTTNFQDVVNVTFVGVLDDANTDDQGIEYTLYDESYTAIVSGHTNALKSEIVIPSAISSNGVTYSVTSIGKDAFENCSSLTSVTIPNSVTSIGYYAFGDCKSLTSVTIPNSVTSIGNRAFRECTSLTSVTIPNSVTSIGDYAFSYTALTSVTIPNSITSIGMGVFWSCGSLTSLTIPNRVTSIGIDAFYECTSITDVYCYADPDNLTWNEKGCDDFKSGRATKCHVLNLEKWTTNFQDVVNVTFVGDILDDDKTDYQGITYTLDDESHTAIVSGHTDALKSEIVIPATITSNGVTYSVTSIGESAFYDCTNLASVTIPNSVTSIGNYAFGNTALVSVTIPNSVTSIGNYAFVSCSSLTSVTIPNSVTSIGNNAFYDCTNLTSVTIPNSVTSIGDYAFRNTALTSVTIPNSVTSIGNSAFRNTALTSVTIPNSVTSIGKNVFENCNKLTSVTIPNSVTSIGESAFQSCSSLTSVTIPNSVTSIGKDAFYGCTSITDVYCYADPDKMTWDETGCNDFQTDRATKCHVPSEYLKKWNERHYTTVNVTFDDVFPLDDNNTDFQGITYTLDDDYHTAIVSGHTNALKSEITIPSAISSNGATYSVTSIGEGAFFDCEGLTSVTIPNSVTSIGKEAFYGCTSVSDVYCYADPDKLSWNDGGCDDFQSGRATKCHVLNLDKWTTNFQDVVNVTFVDLVIPLDDANADFQGITYTLYDESLTAVVSGHTNNLKSEITIPSAISSNGVTYNVTSIGNRAFVDCESLTFVTIPNSVTSIGADAFYYCKSLTSVTIPNSVTSIGKDAFYGCRGITDVYCYADPDNLTWNDGDCDDFKSGGATKCHVLNLEKWNTKFKDVVNVTFVDDLLDDNNADFQGIKYTLYNGSHTAIVSGHTDALKSEIVIPSAISSNGVTYSVTSIGNSAFESCSSLTSVTIPNSVTSIGQEAFLRCTSVTDVYYYADPDNLTWNDGDCDDFKSGGATKCHVLNLEKWNTKFKDVVNVTFVGDIPLDDNNTDFQGIKYTLNNGSHTAVVSGHTNDLKSEIVIPATISSKDGAEYSVTSIGKQAFYKCTSLTSVTIPNGVTSIGDDAFYNCDKLTSVTIPNSVTSIGDYAFRNTALTSVTIPNSVKRIGYSAFRECKALTSVTIPNSVTSIDGYAFSNCNELTSVTIPNSVTSIGFSAFRGCKGLSSVTIERGDLGNFVLEENIFSTGASGCNIELKYTGTLHDGFSVAYDITDGAGISIDGNKMVFTGETSEATLTTKEVSGALTITKSDGKYIATIDGAYTGADAFAIGEDIEVASVTFNRTFTSSATSTIILPFYIAEGKYSGGDFYTLKSVENNIADMTKVTSVTAHTPYLFVPDGETFSITGNVTIKATTATEYATESEDGKWEFKGIYQRKRWGAEDGDNKDYCFAANAIDDISVGEFVKIGTYVQVKPFRCYLTRKGSISKSAEQLPETIKIRLIDETASVITPDDPQDNTGDITTPVSEIANNSGVKVWSYDGVIYIESAPATAYTIVDMTGRTLKNGVTNSTRETVTLSRTAGIVIVIINGKSFKVQY